ncbi:MAG: 3'-5' exonuclease [Chitinophagaceae bacterium]|nr:3'-5' exonuclease [Chitinophagaceae bacterium]
MNIIFFDTETTGLPKNWKAPMSDLTNWPRIIQMAWMVCDIEGTVIRKQNYLIKPDGWQVPTEDFWVQNGFSQQKNLCEGIALKYVLDAFLDDYDACDIAAAHNMDYDRNVLGAELIRSGKSAKSRPANICTKELGTNVCKIPGSYGKYKWPSLTELYQFLFSKTFQDAHDAMGDVLAGMSCLLEMIKRGIIVFEDQANVV